MNIWTNWHDQNIPKCIEQYFNIARKFFQDNPMAWGHIKWPQAAVFLGVNFHIETKLSRNGVQHNEGISTINLFTQIPFGIEFIITSAYDNNGCILNKKLYKVVEELQTNNNIYQAKLKQLLRRDYDYAKRFGC
jgi:hypothetical protein